ncbi:AraC family transcriptional regulator [Portibacter lacus]|uniref:AraC family transcriptional regulator n=1 Tax=Portibacter lacus TaxID=1099794 RepID=A0AA37SQB7_9BACT|nr:AraC family transcriptional regulator [Portibacter lacus]GLR17782.1 AraC family transcriptional regulator [Portibacter lacus]
MKVLPFTIPKVKKASFVILEEKLEQFYPHLHRHQEIQICWIKKGKGTLIVQADIFPFVQDDVFIIASNRAHLFKNENLKGVETLSLFFSPDPNTNLLMSLPELEDIMLYFQGISSCNKLDKSVIAFLEELQNKDSLNGLQLFISLLNSLDGKLPMENISSEIYSEKSEHKMKVIMEYTMKHLHQEIEIKKIADQINYTPESFCRFFRKRTGRTYINYLNELRITASCHQIINQEVTDIRKIAFDSGFNNVSHFNRVFKHWKGCSPLQFRKAYYLNFK